MRRYRANGVITVFFTLISACFIGLIFMLLESARIQGARAQTANITNLGGFSVFGEFEKKLLEKYEIFAVDGSYGSGDFAIGRVNDKLAGYMKRNLTAQEGTLESFSFDPWRISLESTKIGKYTLLTDSSCESFYQQAVAYMKETPITGLTGRLYELYQDSQDTGKAQEKYEREKEHSDQAMDQAQQQIAEQEAALDQAGEGSQELTPEELAYQQMMEEAREEAENADNPLKTIAKLFTSSVLSLTIPGAEISGGEVGFFGLCSKRWGNEKGNLPVKKEHGGLIDDLIFREYLLERFGDFTEPDKAEGELKYQIEYILCGNRSDKDNLKGTIKKLILLRCGCNYATFTADQRMGTQAETVASVLVGWTGIPQIVEVTKQGIIIGWTYAESLMDVRALLSGGKIPLVKTADDWQLSISNLAFADDLLEAGSKGCEDGLKYKAYLRVLLNLQGVSKQKVRAVDLVEEEVSVQDGLSEFRADHCVVAIRFKADWHIDPLFDRVTGAFLGVAGAGMSASSEGGFAY